MFHDIHHIKKKVLAFSSSEIELFHSLPYTMKQYATRERFFTGHSRGSRVDLDALLQDNICNNDILVELQDWQADNKEPYALLLSEYGMGKTIACMRFVNSLLEKMDEVGVEQAVIPVFMDLRNIVSKKDVYQHSLSSIIQSILYGSLTTGYSNHGVLNPDEILYLVEQGIALLVFDGLDEILVHLTRYQGCQFVKTLTSTFIDNKNNNKISHNKILLSCRSHFFRTGKELDYYFLGDATVEIIQKYRLYQILPFTKEQVQEYFSNTVSLSDREKLDLFLGAIYGLEDLVIRPYILSLIPQMLPYVERCYQENKQISGVNIYQHLIQSCFERDEGKHLLAVEHKLLFLEHFSADLWRSGRQSWNSKHVEEWLQAYLEVSPEISIHYATHCESQLSLEVVELLTGSLFTASLIVKMGQSEYRFSHISVQEFFLARYLYRGIQENKISHWSVPVVSGQIFQFLHELICFDEVENDAFFNILHDQYHPGITELAFAYFLFLQSHRYRTDSIFKSSLCLNGVNLSEWEISGKEDAFLKLNGLQFKGANLRGTSLVYVDLSGADFSFANFSDTDIVKSKLVSTQFYCSRLENVVFRDVDLEKSDFTGTHIISAQWARCNLRNSLGLSITTHHALFEACLPEEIFHPVYLAQLNVIHPDTHSGVVNACAYSIDGSYLVSASWDYTLRVWDIENRVCRHVLIQHRARVKDCAFSPCGQYLISVSDDQTACLWDVHQWKCIRVFYGHTGRVNHCAFSPQGDFFVTASSDRTLRVWNHFTGECLAVLMGHDNSIRGCSVSSDGKWIASASEDKTIRLWDRATGQCLKRFEGHQGWIKGCRFSLDNHFLLSASGDKTLRLWNLETGSCERLFKGHEMRVRDGIFFPDEDKILSVSNDHTLRIWSRESGACLNILRGHELGVKSCSFSPKQKNECVSASEDHTLRIWNTDTGKCLGVLGIPISQGIGGGRFSQQRMM